MGEGIFLRRPYALPRKASEYPLFIFLSLVIPVTYWFEIWVVLPSLLSNYPVYYWTAFTLGHFILHNVAGNFLGILMFDTSIRGRKMPLETDPDVKYCSVCDTTTPPRSFHCPSCDICILKRDHHCVFASCCVGFYNHRYFFLFVFYMLLATTISLPFNVYFLRDVISITELSFITAIIFPLAMFFIDLGSENIELEHIYLIISVLGIVGIIFCSIWFYFHLRLILKGTVVYEMRRSIFKYDLGREQNLQMVFGKRWKLALISPYFTSSLPCDGIEFPVSSKDD